VKAAIGRAESRAKRPGVKDSGSIGGLSTRQLRGVAGGRADGDDSAREGQSTISIMSTVRSVVVSVWQMTNTGRGGAGAGPMGISRNVSQSALPRRAPLQ
jgi:hypothetical protein